MYCLIVLSAALQVQPLDLFLHSPTPLFCPPPQLVAMDDPYRMKLGPFLAEFLPCAHDALEVNNGAAMADFGGYLSLVARGQTQFCMYFNLVSIVFCPFRLYQD